MADLAAVTGGAWVRTEQGRLRLERDAALARQLDRLVLAERKAAIEKNLRTQSSLPPFDAAEAKRLADRIEAFYARRKTNTALDDEGRMKAMDEWEDINAGNVAERVTAQFSQAFDPNRYLHLEPGERLIFDRRPTATQEPIGPPGDQAAQALAALQDIWLAELKKRGGASRRTQMYWNDPTESPQPVRASTTRIRLQVRAHDNSDGYYSLQLSFRTPSGVTTHSGGATLISRPHGEARVPKDLVQSTATLDLQPKRDISTEERRRQLLWPDEFEPLATSVGPAIEAAARAVERDVVANIPDAAIHVPALLLHFKRSKVGEFWNALATNGFVKIFDEAGCLRIVPLDLNRTSRDRAPRKPLAELLRSVQAEGRVSLDAIADYAAQRNSIQTDLLGSYQIRTILPAAQNEEVDLLTLRLYGSLTFDQRRVLKAGRTIPFQNLSIRQREMATRIIFRRQYQANEWSLGPDYQIGEDDVSDLFPHGLPADGALAMPTKSEPHLFLSTSSGIVSIRSFAERAFWNREAKADPVRYLRSLGDLAVFDEELVSLRFILSPRVAMERELGRGGDHPRPVPFDRLPQETKAAILDAVAKVRARNTAGQERTEKTPPP